MTTFRVRHATGRLGTVDRAAPGHNQVYVQFDGMPGQYVIVPVEDVTVVGQVPA